MAALTLANIRLTAKNLVNDPADGTDGASTRFSDTEWKNAINDSARDIRRLIKAQGDPGKWYNSASLASLTTPPADCERALYIRNDNTGAGTVLGLWSFKGSGAVVILDGSSALTTATIFYERFYTAVSGDTDVIDLPDGVQHLTHYIACIRYLMKGQAVVPPVASQMAAYVAGQLEVSVADMKTMLGISTGAA